MCYLHYKSNNKNFLILLTFCRLGDGGGRRPFLDLVVHVFQPPVVLHLVYGAVQVRVVGICLGVLVPVDGRPTMPNCNKATT